MLQSAALRISLVVTPMFAAADVAVLLTEWALKVEVSMPAASRVHFSHLAMVDEDTAPCDKGHK